MQKVVIPARGGRLLRLGAWLDGPTFGATISSRRLIGAFARTTRPRARTSSLGEVTETALGQFGSRRRAARPKVALRALTRNMRYENQEPRRRDPSAGWGRSIPRRSGQIASDFPRVLRARSTRIASTRRSRSSAFHLVADRRDRQSSRRPSFPVVEPVTRTDARKAQREGRNYATEGHMHVRRRLRRRPPSRPALRFSKARRSSRRRGAQTVIHPLQRRRRGRLRQPADPPSRREGAR